MTNHIADTSKREVARVAGFMFLFSLLVPVLNWIFVLSKFIVVENVIATANNIMANALLFRIGIANQLVTSVVVVVLALTLYKILKQVNKSLASLALYLKLVEASIVAVIALLNFIALQFLNGQAYLTVFEPEQVQALVGLFLNVHISVTAIPGVLLGLNMTIFSYLLFKSKYVPSILAAFGVLSYALVFIYDLSTILSPNYATILIIRIISTAPICLFVLMIGFWLIIKGVKGEETWGN